MFYVEEKLPRSRQKRSEESNGIEVLPNRYKKVVGSHCNRTSIALVQ